MDGLVAALRGVLMANNLEEALKHIFGHEGGFTRDPRDPGNWTGGKIGAGINKGTKYGIACHSYPHLDIANLTLAQAAEIYRKDYAAPVRFIELPDGVDLVALDAAINSGPSASLRFLGQALAVAANALAVVAAATAAKDKIAVIKAACAVRLSFMRSLAIWQTYGVGWSRRVAAIEATAVRWSLRAQNVPAAQAKEKLAAESSIAKATASADVKKAASSTAGAGGASGAGLWASLDVWQQVAVIALAALLVLGVVYFVRSAIVNRQRATAYEEAAAAA